MFLLTLCTLSVGLIGYCNCSQFPAQASTIVGDNVVALCTLAAFGTIALIGACAFCFRRKKTFEKLENEAGTAESIKKNEYPIFRALATDGLNEPSAIVSGDRNNLSRDNLLNSSDNLTADDGGSSPRSDVVDSSDIVLIEKPSAPSTRDKSQPMTASRDTIIYETEKDVKKHQSPSSSTPLLYANNNIQSYQNAQPTNEQMQQKSATVLLAAESPFKSFYEDNVGKEDEHMEIVSVDEGKPEFMVINMSEEGKEESGMNTNPFFNSADATTIIEDQAMKDSMIEDTSEVESSLNDNSEKYQILEEETDNEEVKEPLRPLQRQDSNRSFGDTNSIEEALRALDIAIGSEDDGEGSEIDEAEEKAKMEEVKEEATFLVESIVNDCEKILKQNAEALSDDCFEDFRPMGNQNMSTPCAPITTREAGGGDYDVAKVLFPEGVDVSDIGGETFSMSPAGNQTFDVPVVNDKTFEAVGSLDLPAIKIDREETGSEDLTTVTPVNTPIELSYSSDTWDKMTTSKGAISKQSSEPLNKTVTLETDNSETFTFNQDGWYLHPQARNDTFEVCDYENDGNMEDMSSTYDQLRRQLTEMLPHAQGMSQHNDFLDDEDLNKDSSSPSENYGIKYGELDEATNACSFDLLETLINPEPQPAASNEMHINYKRPLSPILEESEYDETCRTFVFNNETKLLDSTSTGIMESASAEAQMGQMPKTLMASNDTLFNFEDTLSDQTDVLMSPRLTADGSSGSSTLSRQESHDKISLERTPTNEDAPKIVNELMFKSQELDAIDIMRNNIKQHPLNLDLTLPLPSTSKYEVTVSKLSLEEGSWPLELPEAQHAINDLSSPEQNQTGDSLSFEQDMTYTIDDQKTCVSLVLKNDDERISEISEPIFASESLDLIADDDDDRVNSLQMDDIVSIEADDNFNFELNDENGNQDCETKEMELTLNVQEPGSAVFDNDSINPDGEDVLKVFEEDSLEPEGGKILADDIDADSIPTSHTKSIFSNDSINTLSNNTETVQSPESDEAVIDATPIASESSDDSDGNDKKKKMENKPAPATDKNLLLNKAEITFHELHMAKLTTFDFFKKLTDMHDRLHHDGHCDSSEFLQNKCHHFMTDEDDPWGSSTDIRQVSCNQGMMTTSFTKEWSDDDSSHSSEEFMYVKGGVEGSDGRTDDEVIKEENEEEDHHEAPESTNENTSDNIEVIDVVLDGTFTKQMNQFPATPIFHGDEQQVTNESEDESAEEGEFTPSFWDQSLQPKRSSLKSPEKENKAEERKKSRRVAFKIQRYHSVYEYPCEVVQLSPAYSEPQLWSNYMDDCSGNIDYFTYAHQLSDVATNFPQQIDGFSISSSSRPFHSSNVAQLHNTWPNDSTDFSWSQIQDITDSDESSKQQQFPLKIEWPPRRDFGFDDDSDERPDSGVGESSDLLTDSPSMGELCHTKGSLRLPLELVSSTSSEVSDFMSDIGNTKEQEALVLESIGDDESPKQPKSLLDLDDDESDKMILPTPSCTGSMDSLSSNSGSSNSERGPPSFTTFGKETVAKEIDVTGKTSIIFIEDDNEAGHDVESQTNIRSIEGVKEGDETYILSNKLTLTVGSSDEDSGFENISRNIAIK